MIRRRPVRPSLTPIARYTPLRPVGPAKAKREAKYKAFMASPAWRRIRKDKLDRERVEGPDHRHWVRCAKCKEILPARRAHCHHTSYLRFGGNERPEDLEVTHRRCHERHHAVTDWWKPRRRFG